MDNQPLTNEQQEFADAVFTAADEFQQKSDHIVDGIELISDIIKKTKKPIDKASLKSLKDSLKVLKKKYKMMMDDEKLYMQYIDKTMYDVVQGVFQTFHLYIISTTGDDDEEIVGRTLNWLRTHDTAYDISKRIRDAAERQREFGTK